MLFVVRLCWFPPLLWFNSAVRAAAIFGIGSSPDDLKQFQRNSGVEWQIGMPAYADDADAILIFGGDGTLHRHLAQLVKLRLPVLVVPRGSGNDFARALGIRSLRSALDIWERFRTGKATTREVDLGVITPVPANPRTIGSSVWIPPQFYYFACIGGVGLDAEVARRANEMPRWLRARGGYALTLPGALARFRPQQTTLLAPNGSEPDNFLPRYSQPTFLAAFANTPVYGGGMRIAPNAELDDGALDVCLVGKLNKLKLASLFPTVYFGRHLNVAEVDYFRAVRLRVETERPADVYADGEFVCRTPAEVSTAPRALTVVCA